MGFLTKHWKKLLFGLFLSVLSFGIWLVYKTAKGRKGS